MFSLHSNILAMNTDRQFNIRGKAASRRTEKLSSGYRVNRAADDASGLSISEKMRRQIRGLTQASRNAQDGISLIQTAEGAMGEIHDMLQRVNELAVNAANGTLTDEDRVMIDAEVQQLKAEIDTTASHTVFNEIRLFPEDGLSPSAGHGNVWHYDLTYHMADGSFTVYDGEGSAADVLSGLNRASVNPNPAGGALADKIATEFIPKAAAQIFSAFPSIKNAIGSDNIDIKITVTSIDGSGQMLARAGFKYYTSGGTDKAFNLEIQFDSNDFTLSDAEGSGGMAEALQSTIAHELMHSMMQYTMTDGMSGRKGEKYPEWFTEGTAQLAGGGFPTGWNNSLISYAGQLTNAEDDSQDANIKSYLARYTADARPYGHGYLAAAYAGWLAGGKGDVAGGTIAKGMDRIFSDLIKGNKLADVIFNHTGLTEQQLKNNVSSGAPELLEFVRKLSYKSLGGAGSVITPSLATSASGMIGSGSVGGGGTSGPSGTAGGARWIGIQVGADSGQHITIGLYRMDVTALGMSGTNVRTVEASGTAIDEIKKAIGYVSRVRSDYGAIQNRLEHTVTNLENVVENTASAESLIRDTDISLEMIAYSGDRILLQAGQAMLAQANQQQSMVLNLLS